MSMPYIIIFNSVYFFEYSKDEHVSFDYVYAFGNLYHHQQCNVTNQVGQCASDPLSN